MLHHISTHLYVYNRTGYILKKPNFFQNNKGHLETEQRDGDV